MKLIDSKGRLFGKISLLDLGAGLIILCVIVGIFFVPNKSGSSVAQITDSKPIQFEVLVRGLSVKEPLALLEKFKTDKKVSIIIRNQPYGEVEIKDAITLDSTINVPQPDGSVKALPDARPEVKFNQDYLLTLGGKGQVTKNGIVLGNNKIMIGAVIELEGFNYNFKGSVISVQSEA